MSDENGLPLHEPAPPQPTFPQININVTPQGMVVSVELAPGVTGTTIRLGEDMMNNITKMWTQTRKDIADQMRVIEQVRHSKNK